MRFSACRLADIPGERTDIGTLGHLEGHIPEEAAFLFPHPEQLGTAYLDGTGLQVKHSALSGCSIGLDTVLLDGGIGRGHLHLRP